jgi:uncharacterized protein YgfB (UPF0149 family)
MFETDPSNENSELISMPDFDEVADLFWRLGVMQSPSQLQGYLIGQLAVGNAPTLEQWLQQAAAYTDSVEPPNSDENQLLAQIYQVACGQLTEGAMGLQLLLPDDAVEITQRTDSLGAWCKGFLTGFAMAGKEVQQQQGQRQYSKDVSEALSDMGAISQVVLTDEDSDEQQREQNFFEIAEYLRLAAITIFLECNRESESTPEQNGVEEQSAGTASSPAALFGKNKLH